MTAPSTDTERQDTELHLLDSHSHSFIILSSFHISDTNARYTC
jgi:hypothetical protein